MYTDKYGNTLNIGDHVVIDNIVDIDDNDIIFEVKLIDDVWMLEPIDKKLRGSIYNNLSLEIEFNKKTLTKI